MSSQQNSCKINFCDLFKSIQVEDAIIANSLPSYLSKCNNQIDAIVELVRGNLSPGITLTVEALIVLDVHGM